MKLSEISIQRPVLATMMNLALILFGLVALTRLPVRELPDIDPPVVSVLTVYPGANASVVETEITEKLEEAINSIEGIKELTSESKEQVSSITVQFDLSREIEAAAQDVRDRVARVRGNLPDDIDEPVVSKQDADANPVMWIALFSEKHSTLELSTIAENLLKDRLQTVKGVSSVIIGGQKRFAIRIRLDAEKMAAHQISVTDVDVALKTQNLELPSGRVEGREREMTIQTLGEMKTAEEFNRLVIRQDGGSLVRLQDIGRAEVGVEDERSIARYISKPAVGLGIVRQSKANVIEVARGVKKEIEKLTPLLPAGVQTLVPYDESIFVEESIHEVWVTLGVAFVLVVLTIFVFLRNIRSTLIPCVTIPVSVIGTYMVLSLLGYSINILTMLALVLAIGIVVDDSIVVLENIYRHIEEGMKPMDAAFQGMREISFAVIATTLSLVAVFIPLAFQTTVTGRLFVEFAIALAGSVIISAFVALTLTPTMSARILRPMHEVKHGRLFNFFEHALEHFQGHYERMLRRTLRHRKLAVLAALAIFGSTAWLYTQLDKEFLPEEDKGRLLTFMLTPEGSTAEYSDRMMQRVETIVRETPEVDGYFSAIALGRSGPGSVSEGFMFIRLKDERERGVTDIVGGPHGLAATMVGTVEGALAFPIIPKAVSRGFGQSFQLVLQESDLGRLNQLSQEISGKLRAGGLLGNVRSHYEVTKPELRVRIDRDRAAVLGVSVENISRTLQVLFGGSDLSQFKVGGKEYDVIAQLERDSRLKPTDLDRLYVRSDNGRLVQLSNLVSYEEGAGPTAINHFNRFRASTIEGTPVAVTLGTVVEQVEQMLARDYPGLRYAWAGETSDLKESGQGFIFVIILALIVVYMVLASQFESLLHPLTIMLTLPIAAFGAFGALWVLNWVNLQGADFYAWANYAPNPPDIAKTLSHLVPRIPAMNINLFSQIGIVLLIGMATKNSILLVEFANQQRSKGKNAMDAILDAGLIRFRPILMTSFSTILGILPIAIGWGAGGESRRPMGVAAVGGLLTSTFLTLLLIPVAYTLFADLSAWLRGHRRGAGKTIPTAVAGILALLALSLPARGEEVVGTTNTPAPHVESYTLNRCIETALQQNFDILKAKERVRRQYGTVIELRSRLLPTLGMEGQYSEMDRSLAANNAAGIAGQRENWNLGLKVTQSLYAGGADSATFKGQKLLEQASVRDLQSMVNEVLLEVRVRYFGVLLARSQIRVQEQNIALLDEELQSARNKLQAGAVSPFNVLRAEVARANGQPDLIRARNNYRIAVQELGRVLGLGQGSEAELDVTGEMDVEPFTATLSEARALALDQRPELKALNLLAQAQTYNVRAQQAGYRPSLSAYGTYGLENDRTTAADTWDSMDGWQAGVQLGWNLFDGMNTRGKTMQAASDLQLAKLDEEQARLNIDVEVRRTYSSFQEAGELVAATRKVVEQAEESVRLARSRFEVGAATQLDVLQTQQALTQTRDNEVQSLHDYQVALARLRKAMGVLDPLAPADEK
jgi:hydrophobe/amphiphile efflux-1 (HAE1) family protein